MRTLFMMLALVAACAPSSDLFDDEFESEDTADPDPAIASHADDDAPLAARVISDGMCKNNFEFEKEFLIRDLAVVEDATRTTGAGAWTFGHLLTKLGADGKQFLSNWRDSPTLDGQVIRGNASKVDDLLLTPWSQSNFAPGKAPFRLLAIVLRPEAPGGAELRFVYSAVSGTGSALPMNVAFEYAVTPAFMVAWHDKLSPLVRGSAAFNAALAQLTEDGTTTLKQIRTNETAIEAPWDLREFHLVGGNLVPAKLSGVPKIKLDGDASLANGVTGAMETYQAPIPEKQFTWTVPGLSPRDRFQFGLGTCNGCHSHETRTEFTHIQPREAGKRAQISSFLESRICEATDTQCKKLETDREFNAPELPSHRFTIQDDRMHALNLILAAANDCQP